MFDLNFSPQYVNLQLFVQLHSEALQNAALLLGGKPALKSTFELIEDICSSPSLTQRLMTGLARLHELLSLEHVHNPERPEWAYFADLDPAAPYVEDICLLSEALKDLLIQLNPTGADSGLLAA